MPKYKAGDYVAIDYHGKAYDVAKIITVLGNDDRFAGIADYIVDAGFDDNPLLIEESEIVGITDDRFDFDKLN